VIMVCPYVLRERPFRVCSLRSYCHTHRPTTWFHVFRSAADLDFGGRFHSYPVRFQPFIRFLHHPLQMPTSNIPCADFGITPWRSVVAKQCRSQCVAQSYRYHGAGAGAGVDIGQYNLGSNTMFRGLSCVLAVP
jgi:hypothetical protein